MASQLPAKPRFMSPPRDELPFLRTPLTAGEKIVLEFFDRNLSKDWEIYIQPHLNGLRPDFVLLNPKVGIAVFEVKDWNLNAMPYRVKYSSTEQPELWATSRDNVDFRVKENPIEKVLLYKESIANLYCPQISNYCADKSPSYLSLITAGVIVTTASTEQLKKLFQPFYKHRNLFGNAEKYHPIAGLDALQGNKLEIIFPSAQWKTSNLMNLEIAQALRSWLIEPDFAATQRQPLELNEEQRKLVTTRTRTGYRRIKGAAGSGKSLVLAGRAAHLSIEHKDVLVVTFNITLWHYLRDLAVRYPLPGRTINQFITWLHFHEWCKQVICQDAGLNNEYKNLWKGITDQSEASEILETKLINLTKRAIDIAQESNSLTTYDAILVDEGQDYNPDWWGTLRRVLRDGGEMVLAADETQDLYERARKWTDEQMTGSGFVGAWSRLKTSYRMPTNLIEYLRKFAEQYLPGIEVNLPEPEALELNVWPAHLKWIQVNSYSDVVSSCIDAALEMPTLATPNLVSYSDIVLLVPDHRLGLDCVSLLENKNFQVLHVFDKDKREQKSRKMSFFAGDARIKACTIHSFKGWEARYIVVAISETSFNSELAATYVALSRLKRHTEGSYLTVVCSAPGLEDFGKTWPSFEKRSASFDDIPF
jgi:hypothetical protein